MTIKRYIWNLHDDGGMYPDEHGDWVEYQDHLAKIQALRAKLEACELDKNRLDFLEEGRHALVTHWESPAIGIIGFEGFSLSVGYEIHQTAREAIDEVMTLQAIQSSKQESKS